MYELSHRGTLRLVVCRVVDALALPFILYYRSFLFDMSLYQVKATSITQKSNPHNAQNTASTLPHQPTNLNEKSRIPDYSSIQPAAP
jgi:hypothetical protein